MHRGSDLSTWGNSSRQINTNCIDAFHYKPALFHKERTIAGIGAFPGLIFPGGARVWLHTKNHLLSNTTGSQWSPSSTRMEKGKKIRTLVTCLTHTRAIACQSDSPAEGSRLWPRRGQRFAHRGDATCSASANDEAWFRPISARLGAAFRSFFFAHIRRRLAQLRPECG